jgi:hypothetical protein
VLAILKAGSRIHLATYRVWLLFSLFLLHHTAFAEQSRCGICVSIRGEEPGYLESLLAQLREIYEESLWALATMERIE